jgi:hypothetical protein
LVQARVVDGERGLAGDREGRIDRLAGDRVPRTEAEDRQRGDRLGRGRDRHDRRRPALRKERTEQLVAAPETVRPGIAEQPLHCGRAERLRPLEQHTHRLGELNVLHVQCAGGQQLAPLVGHPDHCGVDVEHVDDRLCKRVECLVERKLLRERA